MDERTTKWICERCGVNVGYWYYGWKHQNSWKSGKKSCGEKPIPVEITIKNDKEQQS